MPVTIDGSGSYGRSGGFFSGRPVRPRGDDLITFHWTIVLAPGGSAATIQASSPTPLFVPDRPGAYALELVVTDSSGLRSAPDEMTVLAYDGNAPPNVRAGRRRTVPVGAPVDLDATPSFDPEGGPLTFLWWLVAAPAGSHVTDSDIAFSNTANPRFTPDVAGPYVLQLQASDGQSNDELRVIVSAVSRNPPVFADAGPNQRVRPGEVVSLRGAGSGELSWSLVSRPAGSALTSASIRGAENAAAEFTPDAPGVYICRFEASDGRQIDGDNVLILVKENQLPRAAADAASAGVYSSTDIDVLANDADPDGDPLSILAVSQGSQGTVSPGPNGTIRYRPNPGALGTDTFRYTIGDGHGGTDSATVTVTISTLGQPVVESFSPSSGQIGDVVTLTGANLGDATGVTFARTPAAFTALSPTRISAVVPPGAKSGPIAVVSPGGIFTTAKSFAVTGTPDFALAASPGELRVRAGEQGTLQVTLKGSGDLTSAATLTVRGLPDGATAKFTVPSLAAGHSTQLKIDVAKTTPDGSYPFLVTASRSSGGVASSRSAPVVLEVFGGLVRANSIICGAADLSGLSERIYVSPTGADTATCGLAVVSACASISQGIARCAATGCGVLVRHGRYPTSATIALRNGVNVYGGCDFSGGNPNVRTVIEAGPAPGTPAVSAVSINSPTIVHGLVVIGNDVTAASQASIAMAVTDGKGLTLTHSVLAPGKGGDGATPPGRADGLRGGDGSGGSGTHGGSGSGGGSSCPSNHVSSAGDGGQGGDGLKGELGSPYFCLFTCPCAYPNLDASLGKPGVASGAAQGGGGGGRSWGGLFCTGRATGNDFNGKTGGFGVAGSCGAQGGTASSQVFGTARGASWVPTGGGSGGADGSVGGGGGGGSSGGYCVGFPDGIHPAFIDGYPGGGGGGGGCGGNGGSGGQQGGASISLMLVNSTVPGVPSQNSLIPGPGGRGADGGLGGVGGLGGYGGPGHPAGPTIVSGFGASETCPAVSGSGGLGAQGGAGGGGAGGNGGPSIGIALVSGSPDPGSPGNYPGIYAGLPGAPGARGAGGQNASSPIQPRPCKAADGLGGIPGGAAFAVNLNNPVNAILTGGQSLAINESRKSAAGIELIMQNDSNLCLYKPVKVNLWCTNTAGSGAVRADMQTDGNFVLYTSSGAVPFDSKTVGHPGAYLVVEDDGHAVIYDGPNVIWRVP